MAPFTTAHIRLAIVAFIGIVAAGVFCVTLVHAVFSAPDSAGAASASSSALLNTTGDPPARLQIPALGIDARVQYVGVTKKGAMGVPSNFTDVAWYRYGTVPGQIGSAVIDGHVDNGLGLAGVFKKLADIQPGEDIFIETKDGTRLHFTVEKIVPYFYQSVPTGLVFNRSDKPRLNLITCEGVWVHGDRTYDHRLVVYATLSGT